MIYCHYAPMLMVHRMVDLVH